MPEDHENLQRAILRIPPGRWGVAVSGGSDSMALLHLVHAQRGGDIHAIHLDHQTRGGQSTRDAEFVRDICALLHIPLTLSQRSALEPLAGDLPSNTQARFRELRLMLYRQAVAEHGLLGVLQAHHADDQAETILMRLLRGTGIEGLGGIPADSSIGALRILRPLLKMRKADLLSYLRQNQLQWREDSSNLSPKYHRNQVRQFLAGHAALVPALRAVQECFSALLTELAALSPPLGDRVPLATLAKLHPLVQLHVLRRWAIDHGADASDLTLELIQRARLLFEDMASGPSVSLPGKIEIRRQGGALFTRRSAPVARRCDAEGRADPS